MILAWADAYFERAGKWPKKSSGPVENAPRERWDLIDNALCQGNRGLPGGESLAKLLTRKRGVRHRLQPPPLTKEQIWQWAVAHFQRTGKWPMCRSGAIPEAAGETWNGVEGAFREGRRGLPKLTLAKFLAQRRQQAASEPC